VLCLLCSGTMFCHMPAEFRDTETHRTSSLSIAGFSVTIFAGLVVLEGQVSQDLMLPIYFAAMSFIGYLVAHAVQGYKLWHVLDQFADAAMDSGSLCLIAALVALLLSKFQWSGTIGVMVIAAVGAWAADHVLRWYFTFRCHKGFGRMEAPHGEEPTR